jgi:predicted lipoprotein with Yx(FWY)xxD motif
MQSIPLDEPYIHLETRDHEEIDDMRRTGRPILVVAALALTFGALSAAVGPGIAGAASTPANATQISTVKNAKLGTILVAEDTVVYTLKGNKSCNASCQKSQPPVLLPDGVTSPTAGSGVDAAKLGTASAANGALQITYGGKRLYWSTKDKSSGQAKGAGKNKFGTWAAVVITKSGPSGTTSTTSPGNGGAGF